MIINTLRTIQNDRHFADDMFTSIFLNENIWILINISLKFVPEGQINNIPSLVQIMAWRPPGDKPLSEPMMVSLLMHICVTQSQWVKPWPQLPNIGSPHWILIGLTYAICLKKINLRTNKCFTALFLIVNWPFWCKIWNSQGSLP